ncbi:3-dehydroquinate synthase [Caldicellulosiruptor acetigenus]|uniref:3-dehydroquinate synthase n=1 Tax=Caldicellulosiruptor acetigenus 6A TaxID=632516 RepID=G2PTS2_9FIRM|nr:3-dehydroquinate synthase [Caldicellulosiruptor acetigenus]AEM73390.1 3-dehydroquinate synthase [Caldicellulosiruptor acetigenus 6A]
MEDKIYLNLKREEKNIPIVFVERIEKIREYLASFNCSNLVIFTDKLVYRLYKDFIDSLSYFNLYLFDEGEKSKSIESYLKAIDYLLDRNVDRRALFVAIGGGVVGDVVGFIASTFKRGVKLVHIPTTLLSMVDSSIGGKTGINYKSYKNQVGTFYQPEMIIICPQFLGTLPKSEVLSGIGEIIKYGFTLDKSILDLKDEFEKDIFEVFQDKTVTMDLIKKSVNCKVRIVEKDEKESLLREVLNFGHTVGHALETYYDYCCPHGIFVIYGMIAEMIISNILFGFDLSNLNFLVNILENKNIKLPQRFESNQIISIMKYDKKNIKDSIRMVLLKDVCDYILGCEVDESILNEALDKFAEIVF